MSKQERADIVDALNGLPNDQLQFILGYAAGLTASAKPAENADSGEDVDNKAS